MSPVEEKLVRVRERSGAREREYQGGSFRVVGMSTKEPASSCSHYQPFTPRAGTDVDCPISKNKDRFY